MIGYVTVGTNDLKRAVAFFDELLAELGARRFMEEDTFVAWSVSPEEPGLAVTMPFNGEPATVGNGCMTALQVGSKEAVERVYAKALELGATCEGPVGSRMDGFYAGIFVTLMVTRSTCSTQSSARALKIRISETQP